MSATIEVAKAGEGRAESYDGEFLACVLRRAFAPGTPMKITFRTGGGELALDGRCVASKRRGEGEFDVRVRLVSLRRADHAALAAALPG